jgi:hypothetical protein
MVELLTLRQLLCAYKKKRWTAPAGLAKRAGVAKTKAAARQQKPDGGG